MGYCYLCDKEWTGYWGEYFCADCENLKKIVLVVGSKRITDNIKWSTNKVVFEREEKKESSCDGYNTRSKTR
jgi:hypothetical protein